MAPLNAVVIVSLRIIITFVVDSQSSHSHNITRLKLYFTNVRALHEMFAGLVRAPHIQIYRVCALICTNLIGSLQEPNMIYPFERAPILFTVSSSSLQ